MFEEYILGNHLIHLVVKIYWRSEDRLHFHIRVLNKRLCIRGGKVSLDHEVP